MNGLKNKTNKIDRIQNGTENGRSLVRECVRERSRFSRVFETKNGEKAAVIYPVAVHFQKDGA